MTTKPPHEAWEDMPGLPVAVPGEDPILSSINQAEPKPTNYFDLAVRTLVRLVAERRFITAQEIPAEVAATAASLGVIDTSLRESAAEAILRAYRAGYGSPAERLDDDQSPSAAG